MEGCVSLESVLVSREENGRSGSYTTLLSIPISATAFWCDTEKVIVISRMKLRGYTRLSLGPFMLGWWGIFKSTPSHRNTFLHILELERSFDDA